MISNSSRCYHDHNIGIKIPSFNDAHRLDVVNLRGVFASLNDVTS